MGVFCIALVRNFVFWMIIEAYTDRTEKVQGLSPGGLHNS